MNKPSIVFMGTPEFSVPSLIKLHHQGYDIKLVVTQPDRKKGRGRNTIPSAVKEKAIELGLSIYQPEKINSEESYEIINNIKPDFYVVVAYGQILTQKILSIPKIMPINIHGSLLPKYRGAAPIHHAIIHGEKETGITTMIMTPELDSGDMLLKQKTVIKPIETLTQLHDRLSDIGSDLIINTLESVLNNTLVPEKQDHSASTYAPMLLKKDGRINWASDSQSIHNFIRGINPWPGSYTLINNDQSKRLKIFDVSLTEIPSNNQPGFIFINNNRRLFINTGDGVLQINEIQGASGKRMKSEDFLLGYRFDMDTLFV